MKTKKKYLLDLSDEEYEYIAYLMEEYGGCNFHGDMLPKGKYIKQLIKSDQRR